MTPDWLVYANQNAVRNMPLSPELIASLSFLEDMGLQAEVFSGGQPMEGTSDARVGSVRHDGGNAADLFFLRDGKRLSWGNADDLPIFEEIVGRARANGITGIGAGPNYMQPGSMHIGFGNEAVWGADGKGRNAPEWLKAAFYGTPQGPATPFERNVPAPNPAAQGPAMPALGPVSNPAGEAPTGLWAALTGQNEQGHAALTGLLGALQQPEMAAPTIAPRPQSAGIQPSSRNWQDEYLRLFSAMRG